MSRGRWWCETAYRTQQRWMEDEARSPCWRDDPHGNGDGPGDVHASTRSATGNSNTGNTGVGGKSSHGWAICDALLDRLVE